MLIKKASVVMTVVLSVGLLSAGSFVARAYDGEGARQYADSHAKSYDPNFPHFSNWNINHRGSDCTNFVSLAMALGGHFPAYTGPGGSLNEHDMNQWWMVYRGLPDNWDYTDTWIRADKLNSFLLIVPAKWQQDGHTARIPIPTHLVTC